MIKGFDKAVADMEVGKQKMIPLWLFGFLY